MGITADLHCQGPKPAVMGVLEPVVNTCKVINLIKQWEDSYDGK
jgi:hypothetical protein